MNGKNVILIIVVSVLSLVVTVASYYGYARYFKLRFDNNTSKYAHDYLKLDRGASKKKILVSLYCSNDTPYDAIKDTINSILDQTVRPDQIIVNVPPGSTLKLDDAIVSNAIGVVHIMPKDYGEPSSLISPLLREKDAGTIIILASERVIYGIEFVEKMLAASQAHPDCIIYTKGYNGKTFASTNNKVDKDNDVIDADYGVLVKPKFFDGNIIYEDRFKSLSLLLTIYSKDKICRERLDYSEMFPRNYKSSCRCFNCIKD